MENLVNSKTFLVIEDNSGDFILVKDYLKEGFCKPFVEHAKNFAAAKTMLQKGVAYDAILLDISLPDATYETLVTGIVSLAAATPIIVFTGYADVARGINTLALGVADYLLKDGLTASQLFKSIAYSIERERISSELKKSE